VSGRYQAIPPWSELRDHERTVGGRLDGRRLAISSELPREHERAPEDDDRSETQPALHVAYSGFVAT
jgi:hypothetical protein